MFPSPYLKKCSTSRPPTSCLHISVALQELTLPTRENAGNDRHVDDRDCNTIPKQLRDRKEAMCCSLSGKKRSDCRYRLHGLSCLVLSLLNWLHWCPTSTTINTHVPRTNHGRHPQNNRQCPANNEWHAVQEKYLQNTCLLLRTTRRISRSGSAERANAREHNNN